MKYGILFCGYNSEEYVRDSLKNFIDRDNFVISAVSVPFLEYRNQEPFEDNTTNILREYLKEGKIHNLVDFPKFIKEADARSLALDFLKDNDVDFLFIVDADEIYSSEDIENICEYVEKNYSCWYKVPLKNFVFDKKHYLEEPFCPPRIFRKSYFEYYLKAFYGDNDLIYTNTTNANIHLYQELENLEIPKEVAWVDHYTWLNDNIGKRKCFYQMDHFGHCGYKWNEEKECVEFNEEFYRKHKLEIPKVVSL